MDGCHIRIRPPATARESAGALQPAPFKSALCNRARFWDDEARWRATLSKALEVSRRSRQSLSDAVRFFTMSAWPQMTSSRWKMVKKKQMKTCHPLYYMSVLARS
ncbi:hypothetical protein WMY93_015730 [Mugilogobius chulae]|uniref:Uncharacterized protein n=1 Tax=Mugilogobius chulae TaxID=88201 RepID=A0AAW0P341_9GOBI